MLGEDNELGQFHQLILGVVEETDESDFPKKIRTGRPQPRNWHATTVNVPPIDPANPALKDTRIGVALISDYEHGFPDWQIVSDPKNTPFMDDWGAEQKSTRIVDYADPKGHTALFAQLCKVVDDHHQQYSAALVMSTKIGGHATAASGLLWDDVAEQTGKLATVFILNPTDKEGKGRDGHPFGLLGVRTDTHFEWTTDYPDTEANGQHGRIRFELRDVTGYAEPSIGNLYKSGLGYDTSVKNTNSALGHETAQWRPWFRVPHLVPTDGGTGIFDGPNMSAPGDGGITTVPGSLVLPVWPGVPTGTTPEIGRFSSLGIVDDGGGGRKVYVTNAVGTWTDISGSTSLGGGTLAARPATPSAAGSSYVANDKFNGPTTPSGSADPTDAVAIGVNDALTWAKVGLINGWPQTVSSPWKFTGACVVGTGGAFTTSGSGTVDANKLVTKVVSSSLTTNKPLVYNGTQFQTSTLGVSGGGTALTALAGTNTMLYTSASNALAETAAPDSRGGQALISDVSLLSPIWTWDSPGGAQAGSNIVGVNRTISGMRSTGNTDGGGLLFKVSPKGGSGISVNALVTAMVMDGQKNVVVNGTGSALGTTDNGGFFFLPTMAGTPTGTPTTYTGAAPACIDTSANKLWVNFAGTWRSVTLT